MMNIITTSFKYTKPLVSLKSEDVLYIVVHHMDAVTATPEEIHKWHLANGWSGFGYNEYIRKDGTVYIGRGMNVGAQCLGWNSKTYGIGFEGDFSKESPTEAQINVGGCRIALKMAEFKNCVGIKNHYELASTTCPAIDLKNMFDLELSKSIIALVAKGVITSPDYWLQNAHKGKTCSGEYVRQLIVNMSK